MYNDCSTRVGWGGGGGKEKPLMYNVLDTKGEGVGGGFPLPRLGFFLEIWVLNTGFWMRQYKSLINIKS